MKHRLVAAASLALLTAGCANKYQAITPEVEAGMMADLKAGKPNLDCGEGCAFTWVAQVPSIHALDMSERWNDLAVRVMQIGFGGDLAYYYLGQAAQGLGYQEAAITYYNYSLALATGQNPLLKCSGGQSMNGGDPCQGVDLVGSIPVLIQASRDEIAKEQAAAEAAAAPPPPVHHHVHHHTASSGTGSNWAMPPPAATSSSGSGTNGNGWVAPPPAPSNQ